MQWEWMGCAVIGSAAFLLLPGFVQAKDRCVDCHDGVTPGIVAGLLKKPRQSAAFPDLFFFHDVQTPIETKLFLMFMEYRMRVFQGVFRMNPDYAFWYGGSSLRQALTDEDLRKE